jgi:hypothetical protein
MRYAGDGGPPMTHALDIASLRTLLATASCSIDSDQ